MTLDERAVEAAVRAFAVQSTQGNARDVGYVAMIERRMRPALAAYFAALDPEDGPPRCGQWFHSIYASADNPQKSGMYVRTIRRTGRMNRGKFYELTDGRGNFWECPIENARPGLFTPDTEEPTDG